MCSIRSPTSANQKNKRARAGADSVARRSRRATLFVTDAKIGDKILDEFTRSERTRLEPTHCRSCDWVGGMPAALGEVGGRAGGKLTPARTFWDISGATTPLTTASRSALDA